MSQLQTSLILTGDARGLIAATQQGEGGLNKLDNAIENVGRTSKKTSGDLAELAAREDATRTAVDRGTTALQRKIEGLVRYNAVTTSAQQSASVFNAELEQGKSRFDGLRSSLDPLYRSSKQYEAVVQETQRAVLAGAATQTEANRVLALAEAQYLATGNAANTMHRSTNLAGGQLGNIAAQFNDIGVMLAAGQSPLTLALQQGTQLNQVFATMGSGRQVLRSLASAAVSLVNPISLATIGIIAGGAALIQWATAADEADDAGASFVEMLDAIRDQARDAREQVDLFIGGFANAEVMGVTRQIEELQRKAAGLRTAAGSMEGFSRREQGESGTATLAQAAALEAEAAALQQALDLRAKSVAEQEKLVEVQKAVKAEISSIIGEMITLAEQRTEGMLAAGEMITVLQEEFAIAQAIRLHGEGSVEVAKLRIGAERRLYEAQIETLDVSDAMKVELLAAWDAAKGVASADMAGNISLAAGEASRLSQGLATALDLARRIAGYQNQVNNGGLDTLDPRNPNNVRAGTWTGGYSTTPLFDPSRIKKVPKRRGGGAGKSRGGRSAGDRELASIQREIDQLAPSYERDVERLEEWRDKALGALDPMKAGYAEFADNVALVFDEKLAEAYLKDLERRDDWASGVERGLLKMQDDLLTFADVSENLTEKWSSGLEDAFVEMGRTGKFEVGSLVDYTLEQFQRLAFQKAIQPGIDAGFGIFTDVIGGFFPSFGRSATAVQSHAGSTIGSGGVRRSYGPGAPLRADERLTVTTLGQRVFTPEQIGNGATVVDALASAAKQPSGGGSVTFAPQINVVNNSSTPVSGEMREESDGKGGRKYSLVLADEVGGALNTPGGGARRTLKQNYGVKQRGSKR